MFKLNFLLSIFFVSFALVHGRTSESLKVQLPDGSRIIGRYLTSDSGRGIRGFLGIPYAEPPVGELRFKAPKKKEPLTEELKAYYDPPICIQRDPFRRDFEITGSEDCLYLNVFTPEIITKPLAVMVFWHGGGFMCGAGIKPFYGPDFLLEHDVIYVGANYRVGPIGFLSTGDDNCSGNFGLKDQVQVLRWIKENIASFGGSDLVTIFGESAGGASVTYHMQSNLSKGLFHRGIAQSGTNLSPWGAVAHTDVARERAVKLGEIVNCQLVDSNYEEMMKCLRQVPAKNITEAFYDFFKWDTDPMVPFPPVVEHEHDGAFLTENPRFVTNVHGNDIPFMTGLTSEEGVLKTGALIYNQELTADLLKNWDTALPVSLYYDHHSIERQEEITRKINEFYFNNQKLNLQTQANLTDLWTDAWFMHAMMDYLKIRFTSQHKNTFVYYFTHKGAASFSEIFKAGSEVFYGTAHAEELQYIFPIRKDLHYFFNSIPTADDKKLSKIFTKLWVNFAYTGNPTIEEVEGQKWRPTSKFPLDYMRIGDEKIGNEKLLSMENDLLAARTNFWSELRAHFPASKSSDSFNKKSNVKGEL